MKSQSVSMRCNEFSMECIMKATHPEIPRMEHFCSRLIVNCILHTSITMRALQHGIRRIQTIASSSLTFKCSNNVINIFHCVFRGASNCSRKQLQSPAFHTFCQFSIISNLDLMRHLWETQQSTTDSVVSKMWTRNCRQPAREAYDWQTGAFLYMLHLYPFYTWAHMAWNWLVFKFRSNTCSRWLRGKSILAWLDCPFDSTCSIILESSPFNGWLIMMRKSLLQIWWFSSFIIWKPFVETVNFGSHR